MSIVKKEFLALSLPQVRKLGKQPAKKDMRTLQFENYVVASELPEPPAEKNWGNKVSVWGEMVNDQLGDCTCACAGHLIMDWTSNAGQEVVPGDAEIVSAYSAITGYDPQTGLNDEGAVVMDVLNYWRKTGIANHRIEAFVSLEPKNHRQVKETVFLFGGCYLGINLPLTAQDQKIWSVPPSGPSGKGAPTWGGHAIPVIGYDDRYLAVVTWGSVLYMTWEFYDTYCDETYAIISEDWFNSIGQSPSGFDINALEEDLAEITGQHDKILAGLKQYETA